jgi:valyl-tRNA synthetase
VFLEVLEMLVSLHSWFMMLLIFCLDITLCLYFPNVWKACIRVWLNHMMCINECISSKISHGYEVPVFTVLATNILKKDSHK